MIRLDASTCKHSRACNLAGCKALEPHTLRILIQMIEKASAMRGKITCRARDPLLPRILEPSAVEAVA